MERAPIPKMPPPPQEMVRVVLSAEIYSALREIAQLQGLSIPEAFKATIGRTLFLDREVDRGSKILVYRPRRHSEMRQLVI